MKRFMRVTCGLLLIVFGLAAFFWSGYQLLQVKWEFAFLFIFGLWLMLAGYALITGEKLRDIFNSFPTSF